MASAAMDRGSEGFVRDALAVKPRGTGGGLRLRQRDRDYACCCLPVDEAFQRCRGNSPFPRRLMVGNKVYSVRQCKSAVPPLDFDWRELRSGTAQRSSLLSLQYLVNTGGDQR